MAFYPGLAGWAGTRKVKPISILLKQESEWQWHQLGCMQVCTSPQTENHVSTPLLSFFTGRMPFLPPNQQCQSTEGNQLPNWLWCSVHIVFNWFAQCWKPWWHYGFCCWILQFHVRGGLVLALGSVAAFKNDSHSWLLHTWHQKWLLLHQIHSGCIKFCETWRHLPSTNQYRL